VRRRDFLEHVAWTGSGIAYALSAGGVMAGTAVASAPSAPIDFVQISDSHIGFHQAANQDVAATLQTSVSAINALPNQPAFVVHTGDVTHLSKPEQFAAAKDILSQLRAPLIVLPGEHDFIGKDYDAFFSAFPPPGGGRKWFSWDRNGTHFIALINVFDFENMGLLGSDQLDWLRRDLAAHDNATPVVVFTHAPLYALFPSWGWTTQDGAQALTLLQRFDNVTVLSGHIHQVVTHQDGNIRFATADSTAYPQPAPGAADKPGPLALPHDRLLRAIGYRNVILERGHARIDDRTLG
jgi:3',5'-cyclic-AMP phosphodiesterase